MDYNERKSFEKAIVIATVDAVLATGHYTMSVDTGGDELDLENSTDKAEILEALDGVDDVHLIVRKKDQQLNYGWVYFVYGNDGYDVINDHTTNLEELLAPVNELADEIEAEWFRKNPR